MPRMILTEEEALVILRQRAIEDAHRAGWNKALQAVYDKLDDLSPHEQVGRLALMTTVTAMQRGDK